MTWTREAGLPGDYLRDELYHRLSHGTQTFDLIDQDLLDGIWYQDLQDRSEYWISPGLWRTLGFDPAAQAHHQQSRLALIHQDDLASLEQAVQTHAKRSREPLLHDLRLIDAAGERRWMRCRASVMRNADGIPYRLLGVMTDISALQAERQKFADITEESQTLRSINKRLREEIAQRTLAEKRFHHVFNASPNGLMLVNAAGELLFANRRLGDIFGYSADDMVGMSIEQLVPHEYRQQHIQHRETYGEAPSARPMEVSGELLGLKADGTTVPLEIGLSPVDDRAERGHPGDTIASIMDISDRRKVERQIEQYTHDLERSNADLDDFAYAASHDLKAPLRGIQQLSSWIADDLKDVMSGETESYIGLLQNRVTRLENLLDDLLEYSRIGRRHGEFRKIDPAVLACEQFELVEAPEGFSLDVASSVSEMATLPVPLSLILRNLFHNAVKHHDRRHGRITVTIDKTGDGYRFSVFDDGPGVPEDQYERIFQLFRTLKPRDEVEGSGMGLALVKKTLETYKQRIEVGNNTPRGTVFHFTWPAGRTIKAMTDVERSGSREGHHTAGGGR